MADINYLSAILEEVRDQNKALLEAYSGERDLVKKIPKIDERLEKIEYDLPMIKLVTTQTNSDMKLVKIRSEKITETLEEIKKDIKVLSKTVNKKGVDHEKRITRLESVVQT